MNSADERWHRTVLFNRGRIMSTAETKDELREGLAKAIYDEIGSGAVKDWEIDCKSAADAALAYLRAHDTHAEFVRQIRVRAMEALGCSMPASGAGKRLMDILDLCDAEMAKGDI